MKARAEDLTAEHGRAQEEYAAAEHGVLDQTERDLGALLREAVETGNSEGSQTV